MENFDMGAIADIVREMAVAWGVKIVLAIVIFILGRWVAKMVTSAVKRGMVRAGADSMLVSFIGNIVYVAALAFVVIAALAQLGIQTASLIAILGAAGLAVGLALQGSLSNFAAGVMMILFRPFKMGDYVEAGGTAGSIKEIMIFSTKLTTPDNKEVIVPNGAIMSGNIVNYSTTGTRRVDMVFGCGYDDDIKKVKALLEEIVASDDRVLKDPPPTVAVLELADSSVNFAVRPWVKSEDYWGLKFDMTEAVKQRFDAAGISIPFPQQDVHMHQAKAA